MPEPFVSPQRQLVVEVFVANLERSLAFYEKLGFEQVRVDGGFAVVAWEGCELFLDQRSPEELAKGTQANVRIMVPDVDRYWRLAQEQGLTVHAPIADRYYGLRDFTILDPDGFGVRFGSPISDRPA